MAKSKYQESCVTNVEGVINLEDMSIEIEEIGTKPLDEILARFNGSNVKMSIKISNELE